LRQVLHENTFIRAYTYHWDFTRQDFKTFTNGCALAVENMHGATYRFNPNGSRLHRVLYRFFSLPFVHWFGWDITVVLRKA
jgi:hypothetical protein